MRKLSIIIPAYNESPTIALILNRIKEVELINGIEKDVVVVNDCSEDDTQRVVDNYRAENPDLAISCFCHEKNAGKGAAIKTGIQKATGDVIVIQDADLEYDPRQYNLLIKPIADGFADVVYGSRFKGGEPHRILFFWHSIGNRFLTFVSNMVTNLNLTDMETCYKMFQSDLLKGINLNEMRFGFEPEVTVKIARIPNLRLYEVGISYYGRTYKEGKKICWVDGVRALYCIFKYGLVGAK